MTADEIYAALREDISCLVADYYKQALDDGHDPTNVPELLEIWSERPLAEGASYREKLEEWIGARIIVTGMIDFESDYFLCTEICRQILEWVYDSPLPLPLLSVAKCKKLMEGQS